jgi:DNA polymerase III subunit chi
MKQKPKIIFLKIATNQQKIETICSCVQKHFENGDSVLILAPTTQAVQYLDDLFWKYPQESFLPHTAAQSPSKERIVITTLPQNLNNSKILFNLCPELCPLVEQFEIVYELEDGTHPEKLRQSQMKQQAYKN